MTSGGGEMMDKPVLAMPSDQSLSPPKAAGSLEAQPLLSKAKPPKADGARRPHSGHDLDRDDQPDLTDTDVYNPDIYSSSVFNPEINTIPGGLPTSPRRKERPREKGMGLESLSPENIGALSTKALFDYLINSNTKALNAAQRRALQSAFKERVGLRKEYIKYLKQEAISKTADQLLSYSNTAQSLEKAILPTVDEGRIGGMRWGQAGGDK